MPATRPPKAGRLQGLTQAAAAEEVLKEGSLVKRPVRRPRIPMDTAGETASPDARWRIYASWAGRWREDRAGDFVSGVARRMR